MSCGENLRDLLAPLGVYRWRDGSFQWGELKAAGAALDGVARELERIHREADLTTAREEGLESLCGLLGRDYGMEGVAQLSGKDVEPLAEALRERGVDAFV